ncbi:MAG: hypothetical protein B6U72_02620 [Candidatus Altiarchaeales archaeon ex4484_2]|nr:MAG: hypothetical protein B6U72_02620 [Candidatus Altiarchaeales archaeon ex4484_2]
MEEETSYYIESLAEVNGQLAYIAEEGGKCFIVYGGRVIGKEYDPAWSPVEVDGKLVFTAERNNRWFIVREK